MPLVRKVSDGESHQKETLVWGGDDELNEGVTFEMPLGGSVGNAQWASMIEFWGEDLA